MLWARPIRWQVNAPTVEGEKQENGWLLSLSLSLSLLLFLSLSLSHPTDTRAHFHHLIRDAALLPEYSCAELTVGRILHIGQLREQQQGWWGRSSILKGDSDTLASFILK